MRMLLLIGFVAASIAQIPPNNPPTVTHTSVVWAESVPVVVAGGNKSIEYVSTTLVKIDNVCYLIGAGVLLDKPTCP